MKVGDLVIILGGFDKRIRNHDDTELSIGTLDQVLMDNQLSVLMPGGDIWVGDRKLVRLAEEQK